MKHLSQFKAIDDAVIDGEGQMVCTCFDRNRDPIDASQTAEKIAVMLNQFGNRNFEILKKMTEDGVNVFDLIDEFMKASDISAMIEKNKKYQLPILKSLAESKLRVQELRQKILLYGH